jgi:pyruvate dehydrogenase E2 component (dihydrolipoamide acetyltransferase)
VADPVTVPRLGWSMEEGTFVEWLKRDGDQIAQGDALFVLESEKAAENIEAIDAGTLRLDPNGPKPGEKVLVGQVLAYLVGAGETAPPITATRPAAAATVNGSVASSPQPSAVAATPVPHDEPAIAEHPRRKWIVTPRARRVADELGVNLSTVRGSGRSGRIRERDIRAAVGTVGAGRLIPHSSARKLIAARMVAGATQAAPVTLTTRVDATNLVNLREQLKAARAADEVPSYNDLIVKLAGLVLRQHPMLQAQWRDEGLFVPDCVHIALAVDAEAGLLVPVIRDVDTLTVQDVAIQSRKLIAQARNGRLSADQMRDATFTVTNLGMFGIDAFTPIINLPQSAILGVGRIAREAAAIGDAIVPRDVLTFSLTFDHRVVDGAPAARFLNALRLCVEQAAAWLIR